MAGSNFEIAICNEMRTVGQISRPWDLQREIYLISKVFIFYKKPTWVYLMELLNSLETSTKCTNKVLEQRSQNLYEWGTSTASPSKRSSWCSHLGHDTKQSSQHRSQTPTLHLFRLKNLRSLAKPQCIWPNNVLGAAALSIRIGRRSMFIDMTPQFLSIPTMPVSLKDNRQAN